MIQDSGTRREFDTGAVRDIQEGKGRCDLLPLEVIAEYLNFDHVLKAISEFEKTGQIQNLRWALDEFCSTPAFKGDPYDMVLEVSKHFEEGAQKYGERNWQKGIPVHCYIDSAVRHYLKSRRGDEDERHDRAFVWNILCCIWTLENKPELNDFVRDEDDG